MTGWAEGPRAWEFPAADLRAAEIVEAAQRDLPVGQFCVESHLQKYSAFPVGQIISTSSRHPVPRRGAYHDRHERGVECGGRGSVLRAMDGRAGFGP
jgi:hypothetical protein